MEILHDYSVENVLTLRKTVPLHCSKARGILKTSDTIGSLQN